MKFSKVSFFICLLFAVPLLSENITAEDLGSVDKSIQSINNVNKVYAKCLDDYKNHNCDAIFMVVLKEKILYPEAKYGCLIKPLKKIIEKSDSEILRNNASTALVLISNDIELTMTKSELYNLDAGEFFEFINEQLPENLVLMTRGQLADNE